MNLSQQQTNHLVLDEHCNNAVEFGSLNYLAPAPHIRPSASVSGPRPLQNFNFLKLNIIQPEGE